MVGHAFGQVDVPHHLVGVRGRAVHRLGARGALARVVEAVALAQVAKDLAFDRGEFLTLAGVGPDWSLRRRRPQGRGRRGGRPDGRRDGRRKRGGRENRRRRGRLGGRGGEEADDSDKYDQAHDDEGNDDVPTSQDWVRLGVAGDGRRVRHVEAPGRTPGRWTGLIGWRSGFGCFRRRCSVRRLASFRTPRGWRRPGAYPGRREVGRIGRRRAESVGVVGGHEL